MPHRAHTHGPFCLETFFVCIDTLLPSRSSHRTLDNNLRPSTQALLAEKCFPSGIICSVLRTCLQPTSFFFMKNRSETPLLLLSQAFYSHIDLYSPFKLSSSRSLIPFPSCRCYTYRPASCDPHSTANSLLQHLCSRDLLLRLILHPFLDSALPLQSQTLTVLPFLQALVDDSNLIPTSGST